MILEQHLVGTPCTSIAGKELTADILRGIESADRQAGFSGGLKLFQIRCLPNSDPGRAEEIWVLSQDARFVAYAVSLNDSAIGGTDIALRGPWRVARPIDHVSP